jgi:ferrochelatase
MDSAKIGVLLINLGTPDNPHKPAVRRFLKEFLSDPRVIDLPTPIRSLLVHGFILPFRTARSAQAYQMIWDPEKGSPLAFHTQELGSSLQEKLGPKFCIAVGMRYGNPSIFSAIDKLLAEPLEKLIVLPLFPQYSSAATQSAIENAAKGLAARNITDHKVIPHFYNDPHYIQAQANVIAPFLAQADGVLFSYHSLPVRHIQKGNNDCAPSCFEQQPCQMVSQKNQTCYRAQCFETSRLLAKTLGLSELQYKVVFQSKLGRTPWIGPTVESGMQWFKDRKVERLLVACPSFVADCLETLEEIGIRGKEQWMALGGKEYTLAPCLNAQPSWVNALAQMVQNSL